MKRIEASRELLGTTIVIIVVAFDETRARTSIEKAFAETARIESQYSRFIEGNDLAQLNAQVGAWASVNPELYELIAFGQRVNAISEGAFDLTVKSVLEGWGYDPAYSLKEKVPGQIGSIELKDGQVKLGAEIDLGGLGKGYALDRMMSLFSEFQNVCINAGGDIFARGADEKGQPWTVAFEHPENVSQAIGSVDIHDMALACSSPSRRRWRNRHHIVDPQRCLPAEDMLAVYTQAKAGLIADAYSTALFALGYEAAKALLPEISVEAMLVATDGRIFKSEGFQGELF